MAFSMRAEQAIATFADSLGITTKPAADGSFGFVFERSGTLTLTASRDSDRTLASLAKRPFRMNEEVEARVLSLAGPDITTHRCLSAGLARDGSVVVAVSIDDAEMSLPTLETCLQQLMAAQSAIA